MQLNAARILLLGQLHNKVEKYCYFGMKLKDSRVVNVSVLNLSFIYALGLFG